MNEEIKIGGYTLDELKLIQERVRKDASKIIADHTKLGMTAVDEVIPMIEDLYEYDDLEDSEIAAIKSKIDELTAVANENLDIVRTVAAISGVQFHIPFSEEYNDNGNCHRIEEYSYEGDHLDSVKELYSILEDMESDSCNWHSSRC